jgi:5'-methylthioadenosine phosphorylase
MAEATIAIIGGSGLYQMDGMADIREVAMKTPFGDPSDVVTIGNLGGVPIAFLPRHGRGHRISPTELPALANIYALKTLGVEWIISVSAVGSLKQEIAPLDLVIPDQLIDRTKSRVNSFFGGGIVAHVGFADPFCPVLSNILFQTASDSGAKVHRGGTFVVMEGPLFSTRAESNLYRSWGAGIIGMTALPEAKLAREAEICYATIACATDYDCWHESEEDVTVELIIASLLKNVATSKSIIRKLVDRIPAERTGCPCPTALANAIVTDRRLIPAQVKADLAPLVGKYL